MEHGSRACVRDNAFGCINCQYHYNSSNHIAKGAFGTVYQAAITERGDFRGAEHVAVKVVHLNRQAASLKDPRRWTRLHRSLQNLLTFSHDNLVRYHKVTIATSLGGVSIELMMDYHNGTVIKLYNDHLEPYGKFHIAGGDLSMLMHDLRQERVLMSKATAVAYIVQISEGLQFLHDREIIHGDLKPGNILTTHSQNGDRTLAICDLDDIVHMERDITCSRDITNIRGTYRFMSPEMLMKFVAMQESEHPGRKTDMWSLGCIMLELADCVVGNDQKWLRKEQEKIEAGNKVTDERFIRLIIDGYVPCAIETIPSCLAVNLEQCLHTASSERISASLLIQQLKSQEFIMIFRHRPLANECYVFDPMNKSATELTLPGYLNVDLQVLAVSNGRVVCQATVEGSVEIVVWDVQKQTSPTVLFPERHRLPGPMLCPIAVMDKIYFWYQMGDSVQFRMFDLRDGTDVTLKLPPNFCSIWLEKLYGTRDGNRIIFIGGKRPEQHLWPMWVECFDTVTSEWETLPDIPRRFGFAMVVLHKTVYILGGGLYGTDCRSCLRLDLQSATRQWEKMHDLLEERARHCAFISDNRMYVFGGRLVGEAGASGIMEVYDTARGWSTVSVTGSRRFFDTKFGGTKHMAANVTLNWPVSGPSQ